LTIARNLFLQGLRNRSRAVPLDESIRDPRPGPEAETENKAEYFAVMAGPAAVAGTRSRRASDECV
jgi:DNA-directed RNA polymerase specialized sigma24 family protein